MRRISIPVSLFTLVLAMGLTAAQVPQLITHQGKLLGGTGQPVADGSYLMEFRFYDACTGGAVLLTDVHAAVQTKDGIYSVLLGGGNITAGVESNLLGVFKNHATVCVGTKVGTDSEMQPRQQIGSSAFALNAAALNGRTADQISSDSSPVGSIIIWPSDVAPVGWLLCDGATYNAQNDPSFQALFGIIGTSFGGTNNTNFSVPDLRGRFPLGQDDMGGTAAGRVSNPQAAGVGGSAGEERHLLTSVESGLPSHNHSLEQTSSGPSGTANVALKGAGLTDPPWVGVMGSTRTSTVSSDAAQPHNIMPPYLTLNYIIKR